MIRAILHYPWRNRRARVRLAIGDVAEALVWQYQELEWNNLAARDSGRPGHANEIDRPSC